MQTGYMVKICPVKGNRKLDGFALAPGNHVILPVCQAFKALRTLLQQIYLYQLSFYTTKGPANAEPFGAFSFS